MQQKPVKRREESNSGSDDEEEKVEEKQYIAGSVNIGGQEIFEQRRKNKSPTMPRRELP